MSITPTKKLGQHFLNNQRVIERIADAINPQSGQKLAEIGPGTGALTRPLLARGAHVLAVEKDPRCWPVLADLSAEFNGHLTLTEGDALALSTWLPQLEPTDAIVGNLPYNVGTEIVASLLLSGHQGPLTFMLQKEVVQRITAKPGSDDWGRLGILCSLMADAKRLFDVPPGAFNPPPKVMSSIVHIQPLPKPRFNVDMTKLDLLLRTAFGQRRKMLRSSLKPILSEDQIATICPPTARPEELRLEILCQLSNLLK